MQGHGGYGLVGLGDQQAAGVVDEHFRQGSVALHQFDVLLARINPHLELLYLSLELVELDLLILVVEVVVIQVVARPA
ncbi:MAG: hypothetical protein B9S33_00785 [Pedosphaera sp. Tous-C6FEB]|nr:MAG: hypothetical protein B9S33_00785 [Pedosphaera sp. Tous-C6FEB]